MSWPTSSARVRADERMSTALSAVTLVAAGGCLLVGGVFYAFSTFVMSGLARAGERAGLDAMNGINVTAVRPGLMVPFFGTALISLVAAAWAWADVGIGASWPGVAATAIYLVGCIGVTIVGNVPLNDRLAAASGAPDAEETWHHYRRAWTRWNHARTIACVAAGALLIATAFG
jgi:uncharacterized membrane protein